MPFELYEYQLEDVEKSLDQDAILNGSDMGTGKTHTAIATMIEWRKQVFVTTGAALPILIITPLNTFESWNDKLKKQAPELKVFTLNPKQRIPFINAILDFEADVYIMHWESVRLLEPKFEKYGIEFSVVIGDECHAITNLDSQMTKATKKIQCHKRMAMSGTPSGSNPINIYSVLNWLRPHQFSDYWKFFMKYAAIAVNEDGDEGSAYKKVVGLQNVNVFHHIIEPFYIKHLKKSQCCERHPEGVAPHLPDKNYERLYVDLNSEQRRIYDEMMNEMVAWVGEQQDTPLIAKVALTKLTRLMQITLATPVVSTVKVRKKGDDGEYYLDDKLQVDLIEPSSKMDTVVDLLQQDEKPYVVMTSSRIGARLFAERLDREGISCELYTGEVSQTRRSSLVNEFRQRKFRVLVATIQTIGTGTDGLQDVCDTVVFLDRTMSVVKNKQAEDRLYRIGQHHNVTIIDVVARDTINDERLEILDGTWQSIKEFLGV